MVRDRTRERRDDIHFRRCKLWTVVSCEGIETRARTYKVVVIRFDGCRFGRRGCGRCSPGRRMTLFIHFNRSRAREDLGDEVLFVGPCGDGYRCLHEDVLEVCDLQSFSKLFPMSDNVGGGEDDLQFGVHELVGAN